jgi:hypothetical protein
MIDPLSPLLEAEGGALAELDEAARRYAQASRSEATRDDYGADWRDFTAWCQLHGVNTLPAAPSSLRQYFAELAQRGAKAATIARRVVAISKAHQLAGVNGPHPGRLAERRRDRRGPDLPVGQPPRPGPARAVE